MTEMLEVLRRYDFSHQRRLSFEYTMFDGVNDSMDDARQLVMYLAKKEAQMSSTSIGAKLDRTHATVLHACIQIEQRMSIEKDFSREVQAITASLTQ